MRSVFEFKHYKEYLRYRHKAVERKHGELSRLAEAAGCQRTYLSQVLHGDVQLTPDHAVALADHWRLPDEEHFYFCRLVDLARAGTPRLQEHILSELSRLRRKSEDLGERYRMTPVSTAEDQLVYYSSWHWMAIHIISSIPDYQKSTVIAERLELPLRVVEECLFRLNAMGLVSQDKGRWVYSGGNVHLPKTSPLTPLNHWNWRERALNRVQLGASDGIHYTSTFSMSREDYSLLKARILGFLDECRSVIGPSREEELVALNLDFFVV